MRQLSLPWLQSACTTTPACQATGQGILEPALQSAAAHMMPNVDPSDQIAAWLEARHLALVAKLQQSASRRCRSAHCPAARMLQKGGSSVAADPVQLLGLLCMLGSSQVTDQQSHLQKHGINELQ